MYEEQETTSLIEKVSIYRDYFIRWLDGRSGCVFDYLHTKKAT